MSKNGLIRILLNSDPGINPPAGRIYVWTEDVNGSKNFRYRDENGVVGDIGTAGAPQDFVDAPDTPSTYVGQAGKRVHVKDDETGLEFLEDTAQHWEVNPLNAQEGIRPVGNKEIAIGNPTSGKESVFGRGDSYTGVDNILVYTFDGSTFVDETLTITNVDSSKLTFTNPTDGNMIYMTSILDDGVDKLVHPGIKLKIDTATVLGSGDIVFEFWNGSSWEEFNHQSTDSGGQYLTHANEKLETTGSFQYLYNQAIVSSWVKNDPTSSGTDLYWVRYRIAGTITTSPVIDQIKLHPLGRTEINGDGFVTFYGINRPLQNLPIYYGLFDAAGASPSNSDIYFSDKLDVGMKENKFQDGAVDRSGFKIALPSNMCTACPIRLHFTFFGNENASAGDVNFTIRYGLFKEGSLMYTDSASAPSTAVGERSISGSYPMPADRYTIQEMDAFIDVSNALPEGGVGSHGDFLILTFERQGSIDAYSGDIVMVDMRAQYSTWKLGGHL